MIGITTHNLRTVWASLATWQKRGATTTALIAAIWLAGEWHDRLPRDPVERYCVLLAEQDRHLWMELIGIRDRPNPFKEIWQQRCILLSRAGLIYASCSVKQAWIREEYRHKEVVNDIKRRQAASFNARMGWSPQVNEGAAGYSEIEEQSAHIESVCKWFPFTKDTLT